MDIVCRNICNDILVRIGVEHRVLVSFLVSSHAGVWQRMVPLAPFLVIALAILYAASFSMIFQSYRFLFVATLLVLG